MVRLLKSKAPTRLSLGVALRSLLWGVAVAMLCWSVVDHLLPNSIAAPAPATAHPSVVHLHNATSVAAHRPVPVVDASASHPATPACNGKPYNQQVFYNVPNVMARVKGRKLDDLWTQESPAPHDRQSALSLRMCNLTAASNTAATAAAKPHTAAQMHIRTVLHTLTTGDVTQLHQHPTVVLTEAFRRVRAVDTAVTPTPCHRPLTVAFFMRDQVGAPLLRGFMMADYLKARGVATVTVLAKRGAGNPKPLQELQRCEAVDVCVFIKWYAQAFPQLVRECKARGAAVFVDFMDYCNTHIKNVVHTWPAQVDGFIAQSHHQLAFYRALNFTRSVLIPHQHTNVHNRVTSVDRPVRNIGYTGHWRNLGVANQQLFDHIAAWGEPRGIAFKTIEYFQYKNVGKGVADVYKQRPHGTRDWQDVYHTAVDDVDIAIIWPQDDGHLETYFKPVTRLVYWWSHGVPVIFYPTQTYSEAALAAGYPLAATTVQQVEWWMERLVASAALRKEVAALGLRAAAAYSMEGTAARYEHAFCPYASGALREELTTSPPRSVYNGLV